MISQTGTEKNLPADAGLAMPPEWALHRRTWMCWPCRAEGWDGEGGLVRARAAYVRVARAIAAFEPVIMATRPRDAVEARRVCGDAIKIFEVPLDDSWARDSGPTFLTGGEKAGIAWRFNAWGGKYEHYANDAAFAARILDREKARIYRAPLVCEGGAIHTDGAGTLLATEQTLLNPNRNPALNREQIQSRLCEFTGAKHLIWLGAGFSDIETDGHVDNIACFARPGQVILGIPDKSHPDFAAVNDAKRRLTEARDAQGRALEIVEIAQPQRQSKDWRGRPLASSYVNFYIANGAVIMPAFDDASDLPARAVLADCFPGREIVAVDVRDIVEGGGGIHCITQQEPA
ncbi:MAG TPA: agmatine deiminase family protein [Rhizomicrobium sp.]|jgi:agmatine deiminase